MRGHRDYIPIIIEGYGGARPYIPIAIDGIGAVIGGTGSRWGIKGG